MLGGVGRLNSPGGLHWHWVSRVRLIIAQLPALASQHHPEGGWVGGLSNKASEEILAPTSPLLVCGGQQSLLWFLAGVECFCLKVFYLASLPLPWFCGLEEQAFVVEFSFLLLMSTGWWLLPWTLPLCLFLGLEIPSQSPPSLHLSDLMFVLYIVSGIFSCTSQEV